MKIIGALLARDEAGPDRYLDRCVRHVLDLVDEVVVLDDGSTDDTVEILSGIPKVSVYSQDSEGWWGKDEGTARGKLWELASNHAGEDGWILVFDADMLLEEISSLDLHQLCESTVYNSWAMPLWDCWDQEDLMRVDGYWKAHWNPRVWLAKVNPFSGFVPEWTSKEIHSGHLPQNYPVNAGIVPGLTAWRHLAYLKLGHRLTKAKNYLNC